MKNETLVDPLLLFQCMLVMSKSSPVIMKDVIKYKLQSYPPSIFESLEVMRAPNKKSQISEQILKLVSKVVNSESPETVGTPNWNTKTINMYLMENLYYIEHNGYKICYTITSYRTIVIS